MENNELTGIERQLVLQYLIDGNVPVTVTEVTSVKAAENDEKKKTKAVASGVFPVALRGEQMTVMDQGIILLQNPPESVKAFDGKLVRVQFYFNKLGLYFETEIKSVKSGGLALAIPGKISKIQETEKRKSGNFTAILYHTLNSKSGGIKCAFLDEYPLFVTPKWSDVEEEDQVTAKNYLEHFVMSCRSDGKSIGNGLHLISVCRFLSRPVETKGEAIQDRKNPPSIIYIDEQRIVFASDSDSLSLEEGGEYSILLGFPLPPGPIRERTVYVNFIVDNIFTDDDKKYSCASCSYNVIKLEDARYLADKKAG